MKTIHGLLLAGCSAVVLAGCGPSDIASPGTGGNVIINQPATPTPTPTGGGTATVTPAGGCPTIADPQGLTDAGTITGPTGTWRVCSLPNRINKSIRLTKVPGVLYQLPGRVDVGTDGGAVASSADTKVELAIDPGVIIYGGTGVSWLHVNRGNTINAVGTAAAPIIFTSRDNVLGLNSDNSSGQWGGIVLSGRAPTTDCTITPSAEPGSAQCERQTEGAVDPAIYGGANPADSSGTMRYVQIRYSGYVLSGNSELQSLTLQSVGTGTQLSHIQSVNSSDDGIEIFGGRVNIKNLIVGGAEDDSIDTDTGAKTNIQYLLAVQRPGIGNGIIEADSDNTLDAQLPRQNTKLANVTFVHSGTTGDTQAAILLRGGTDYSIANGVMVSPNYSCLRISRTQTASATVDAAIDEAGAPVFRSFVMQCGTPKYIGSNGVTADQVAAIFGSGSNNNNDAFTPTLVSGFINGTNEGGVAAFDAKSFASFFDTTTWIGAVRNAADSWFAGWTCNTSYLNFGAGNSGSCTSLPVT